MRQGLAFFLLMILLSSFLDAQEAKKLSLTLEDYTTRAIQQGIQGRQNEIALENAGFSKEIVFKQTSLPTLTATAGGQRNEANDPLNGQPQLSTPQDTTQGAVALNEQLPTGTVLNAVGKRDGSDKPGFTASITQPLYIFVRNSVRRTREQAELAYENARDSFNSTVLSLRTQAHSLYYNVMVNTETIQVEERKVSASQALNNVTVALVQAGKLAPVEAMRSKIQLQADQRSLENARTAWEKSVLAAKNFIYLPLDEPVQFVTELQFKPFNLKLERLIDYALLHNPSLQTLRRNRELALLAFQAAEEPTRPTLSLNSTYNYAENGTVLRNWTSGASANWLFFDSGVTRDQVDIARLGQTAADLSLADGERSTILNVQNAFLDTQNAQQQIVDFQSSREQARRNIEVLRLRFQNGLERLIDVFDAETAAHDLDAQYLSLLITYNESKDNLSQLIGADVETLK